MNIFNFCGSGSGGSGGTSVLIQYQKTVDSSHNTQMIVADYPYQVISQVEVLAPNMANPTIDAPRHKTTYYCPPEDSSGKAYIGMDSLTILEPYMANPVVDASCNTFTVSTPPHDSAGRVYYGMDSVTVNAPVMETRTVDASINTLTIDRNTEDYVGLEKVIVNAPVMETRTVDASYGQVVVDRDTVNYVGLEKVIVNAPVMKSITINPSQDSSTVYNIVAEGDVAAGYVGLEQVTVPVVTAAIDNNILPENIRDGVTIIGVQGVYNQEFDYAILYNRLVTI